MTEKQKKCIDWICGVLDIEFTGSTGKDAWEFISKYKSEAQETQSSIYGDFRYDETDYDLYPDEGFFC